MSNCFNCLPRPPEKQSFMTDGATVFKKVKMEMKNELKSATVFGDYEGICRGSHVKKPSKQACK